MREINFYLKPKYETSWALIIGINNYINASPLKYAVSDAEEVKSTLINDLQFKAENVITLIDHVATKEEILRKFLSFTKDNINSDDRVLIFFAGHGLTKTGYRGEVGYLVPHDAVIDDVSTFIRWDDFTKNAELIRAKHMLFVMDACYGGLAIHRHLRPGTGRFLKDMYLRFSRQVITAGKANEPVSDSGGPLPNHSIFTGHFIEGIKGKAANEHGIITANTLMYYLYTKVASDINSQQTPHYGQFDGDGDFIISAPNLEKLSEDEFIDVDELLVIPYHEDRSNDITTNEKVIYTKELLSSSESQIKLHDFATDEVRKFLSLTSEDNYAVNVPFLISEFLKRLSSYEKHTKDLSALVTCLSYWSTETQYSTLKKIFSRSCDRLIKPIGGDLILINIRWYPLILLLYSAGIAAIENKNYKSLSTIFFIDLGGNDTENFFVQKISNSIISLNNANAFKLIPGHEQNYFPLSEYLFKLMQPHLEDILFMGNGYEGIFDEFEILYSMTIFDLNIHNHNHSWGPVGRFGWKHRSMGSSSILQKLRNEANLSKEDWGPIKAGMFGGSYDRFSLIAGKFEQFINKISLF